MARTYTKKTDTHVQVGPNDAGKLPPQAPELEASVLGALMIEKDAYMTIADLLRADSFYEKRNAQVFQAIAALAGAELPVDIMTVAEKLKAMGTLEQVGGPLYLSELTSRVASTAHLRYHAQIVAQKATARDLIAMAAKMEAKAYDETNDVEELLNEAEAGVFEISQRSQKRDVTQIDPVIKEAFDRIVKASKNEGQISGVPSGFHALDKITSGWQKSDLIIIAARPAMGKTAFVLSMAKNMAVDRRIPVAVFDLEMSNVQLVNRMMMNVCEIEGDKIKTGKMSKNDWVQLETKVNELRGAPLYIDDTPSLSVFELRSKARKLVREHHVELIIIDYLQLMNANGMQFGSREQEVSIISRNLKALAKELDIPIIALSQLNRGVEARTGVDGKKPQLSDLRESGAIEQDADMVCFIHRPEYYHLYNDEKTNKDLRGLGEIIVAKHRNGATDEVWLRFVGKYARFQNEDELAGVEDNSLPPTPGDYGSMQAVTVQSRMNTQYMSDEGASLEPGNSMGDNYGPAF